MNLDQHKEAILRWVASCQTHEQLQLLLSVTVNYISFERFPNDTEKEVLLVAKEIFDAIEEKKWLVAAQKEVYSLPNNNRKKLYGHAKM